MGRPAEPVDGPAKPGCGPVERPAKPAWPFPSSAGGRPAVRVDAAVLEPQLPAAPRGRQLLQRLRKQASDAQCSDNALRTTPPAWFSSRGRTLHMLVGTLSVFLVLPVQVWKLPRDGVPAAVQVPLQHPPGVRKPARGLPPAHPDPPPHHAVRGQIPLQGQ